MPFGSKGEISKKDMNFFAEFTEKAAKMARYLFYAVIFIVAVLGVMAILIAFAFITNLKISGDIKKLETTLSEEPYISVEAEYNTLQQEISEKTQYLYALGEMRNQIDSTNPASVELAHVMQDAIPNDTYVTTYSINGSTMTISGLSFSYYSASEFINILQADNVFKAITQCSVGIDTNNGAINEVEGTIDTIDQVYTFTITGNLTTDCNLTFKTFIAGAQVTAIGAPSVQQYAAGSEYSIEDINTAMQGTEVYNISYILVDGIQIPEEDFQAFQAANAISGEITRDMTIEIYYVAGGVA